MSFLKEAQKSKLMDRNYRYVYTRHNIKTLADEHRAIKKATLREWDVLCGILSSYILGGRVKSILWTKGVKDSIFYLVVKRMKYILEFWDKPIENG